MFPGCGREAIAGAGLPLHGLRDPFLPLGLPLGNYIPEWNDHLFRGNRKRALELLEQTNNLPEITGRVCPALANMPACWA